MTSTKYARYVVRGPLYEEMPNDATSGWGNTGVTRTETFMSSAQVPGAPIHVSWGVIHAVPSKNPYVVAHDHPYDEVLFFTGFDPHDTLALGAVIELELEDEPHIIDSTCAVYIPAGMRHCPMTVKRVDRPYGLAAICLSGRYQTMDYATPLEVSVS